MSHVINRQQIKTVEFLLPRILGHCINVRQYRR